MKKLVLLRGIQGSGKSSFIQKNDLQNHTLSPDSFRVMLSGTMRNNYGQELISEQESIEAWKMTFYFLEKRMQYDLLTFIDATHCNIKDLNKYLDLANRHNYKIYVIDFEISLEEALKRNDERDNKKYVPIKTINKFFDNLTLSKKHNLSGDFTLLSQENWKNEIFDEYIIDASKYKDIYFISDLQGTFQPINDFFNDHVYDKHNLYIFLGDYVDRGIENHLSVQFLLDNQKRNYIFINGNHEFHLNCWAKDLEIKSPDFDKNTKPQLEEYNISKDLVKKALKRMKEFVIVKTDGKEILASHSGLSFFPTMDELLFMQGTELSYKKEYEFPVDSTFEEQTLSTQYQVHGHRNPEKLPPEEQSRSFSLESNVEYGGYLRIAKLSKNNFSFLKYKNNIVKTIIKKELMESLEGSDLIHEKKQEDGIYSYNFSREAFYNQEWNELTTKARGLFIHKESNTIVARSFDKFFNIGEFSHCSLESLKKMKFPVSIYLKDNGFLGILGHNPFKNELLYCSKSTTTGVFHTYFKTLFKEKYKGIESQVNKFLSENKCSMVFEVIDIKNDPHIIEYNKSQIILLDVIYNTSEFKHVSYEELLEIANKFNFKVKERYKVIETYNDFVNFYNNVVSETFLYHDSHPIEGFVIEDSQQYMVKIKCHYYNYWKSFRKYIQMMINGKLTKIEDILKNQKLNDSQKNILVKILNEKLYHKSNIEIQKYLLGNLYKMDYKS